MRLRIQHSVLVRYALPPADAAYLCRLMPVSDGGQTCLDFRIACDPEAGISAEDTPSGRVHLITPAGPFERLRITTQALVVTHRRDPFAALARASRDASYYRDPDIRERYARFLEPAGRSRPSPDAARIARVAHSQSDGWPASFLITLTRLLHRARLALGAGTTAPPHALRHFADLMVMVCRLESIPARYVTGYLYTGPPGSTTRQPGAATSAEREIDGAVARTEDTAPPDATGPLHAWVECLLPDGGWHGFDPVNNRLANGRYAKVHDGSEYRDCLPVVARHGGGAEPLIDAEAHVRLLE